MVLSCNYQTSYLFSYIIQSYFFCSCHSFTDFIASLQIALKPQPVLFSYDIVGSAQRNSFKIQIDVVLLLKHNFSALTILLAIAWHLWISVFRTQNNSWKDTRRKLQSLLSFLWATVAANQAKWSFVNFYWELNNRWALSNTPMNTSCSPIVLQTDKITFLYGIACIFL